MSPDLNSTGVVFSVLELLKIIGKLDVRMQVIQRVLHNVFIYAWKYPVFCYLCTVVVLHASNPPNPGPFCKQLLYSQVKIYLYFKC